MKSHSNPIKIITLFFVWNLKTFPLKFRIPIRIFPFLYGDPVILPPFFPKNIEKHRKTLRLSIEPRAPTSSPRRPRSLIAGCRWSSYLPRAPARRQGASHATTVVIWEAHFNVDVQWCTLYIYIVCPLCLCLCLWFLLWVFTFVFIWFICVYVYVYAVAVAAAFLTFAWFACEIEGVAHSATDSNTQEYVYILYIYSSAPTPLKYG